MNGVRELHLADLGIGRTLTREGAGVLQKALGVLAEDEAASVVLLTGAADFFCAGGTEAAVGDIVLTDPPAYVPFVHALVDFPLPVVVALEGAALGAGLGLALAVGDFFVAASEARYGAHFVRMGITPGMGMSFWLQARTGPGFAAEMLYSGKTYRGAELARDPRSAALFDRILPRREVLEEARTWAVQFAQAPRATLVELKGLLRPDRTALQAALDREGRAFSMLARDPALKTRIGDYFQLLNPRS